jgi:hypothetical protein
MPDERLRLKLDPLGCELLPDLRAESHAPLLTRQHRVAGQVGLHFQQPQIGTRGSTNSLRRVRARSAKRSQNTAGIRGLLAR